jgi:hypothetical protein
MPEILVKDTIVKHTLLSALAAGLCLAGVAAAQGAQAEILVSTDIAVSTTWTANNTYNLQQQIYVLPGATLTIEAGTRVASTTNLGGSLAVCKGAQIFVNGTLDAPVVMTSKADNGTWREAANEWGNLTIMGAGYISCCRSAGNTPTCSASNVCTMEGLSRGPATDSYGGGSDNDDSGSISYLSIRYGGKVIGLGNELNGLSLGGIGSETDIHHVEIMNNVDDGIEIWGGCVELKYFSIWNIGDDSLDIDQGWRGKAQFGLIVQGHSLNAAQGSGVGDNAIELDGAEAADWQPLTTGVLYNLTVVSQPVDGDAATAWRDNARMQIRNSVFMHCAEQVVFFEDLGDHSCGGGVKGYGAGGHLNWPTTWTTAYNVFPAPNSCGNPAAIYKAQTSGNLIEFKDTVFYQNADYTEANARGVFNAGNNNVLASSSPITAITRGPQVSRGGKIMEPVTFLDARPANDALSSVAFAAGDSFLCPVKFRGAFAPGHDWQEGWTAAWEFGFTPRTPYRTLGKNGPAGNMGWPLLSVSGPFAASSTVTVSAAKAAPNSGIVFMIGVTRVDFPLFGGTICAVPALSATRATDGSGNSSFSFFLPPTITPGGIVYFQGLILDPSALPAGFNFTNAVRGVTQ